MDRNIRLRGGNLDIFRDVTSSEALVCGPAGSGKSVACASKLHNYCANNDNVRCLMIRKTRKSLSESGMVTFENVAGDYRKFFSREKRTQRSSYDYPNGSTIVVGGMDDPVKIMSTDFDLAYVQEAVELTEDDWESITTRLRNGKLPFQQIFGDTNPSYPTHWLKRRCDKNKTRLYPSYHEDNPAYFDATGKITPFGADYIKKLDALTGPRHERLRKGKWVQAEGQVYDIWDDRFHLCNPFPIPDHWPRYVGVDFGFNDPFVALWFAADPDGRLYLYREFYQTGKLAEDVGRFIKAMAVRDRRRPEFVVCDHALGERKALERHMGWSTAKADKSSGSINRGINVVKSRLRIQGDGRPRLCVMRDSLIHKDPELADIRKAPTCLVEEIGAYIWKDSGTKEEPVDKDNHACDAARYCINRIDTGSGLNMDIIFIG